MHTIFGLQAQIFRFKYERVQTLLICMFEAYMEDEPPSVKLCII